MIKFLGNIFFMKQIIIFVSYHANSQNVIRYVGILSFYLNDQFKRTQIFKKFKKIVSFFMLKIE